MSELRLNSKLRVQALIRSCAARDVFAAVVTSGDPDRGAVLVKLNLFAEGCQVLVQGRTVDGVVHWRLGTGPAPVPEVEADAFIDRQRTYDEDLWVVELENPKAVFDLFVVED